MTKKALVVVLGDLARSPRMQYHCMSLANNNYQVTVIANDGGPSGDKACEELEFNQNIKQELMSNSPDFKQYLPTVLALIIKTIWQSFILIYHLFMVSLPHVTIIQNPPSIPTLPIIFLYSKLTGSKLIIDWHNYGYSILSLNIKSTHFFVQLSKWIEVLFGRLANAGFCVSEAMLKDLVHNFQITYPLYVLYDKPPKHFKPLSLREKHNFYLKIKDAYPAFQSPFFKTNQTDGALAKRRETRFTITDVMNNNVIMSRPLRPAVIISSTSWTEDEDFGLLLEALKCYDRAITNKLRLESSSLHMDELNNDRLPDLVCVITGKGPLKSLYEIKIKESKFEHIDILLPWLSATDYAKMVASCDLGISLHSSSSGVDLPMKVVDMFGCGIPVLAYNYPAISELVKEDFYGLTFRDSGDLFEKLVLMFKNFYGVDDSRHPNDIECSPLDKYKKNIKRHYLLSRWEDNWNREAKPVFDKLYAVSTGRLV